MYRINLKKLISLNHNSSLIVKLILICSLLISLTSCIEDPGLNRRSDFNNLLSETGDGSGTSGGTGQGAGPGDGGIGNGASTEIAPKIEIRHFVNPRTGNFVRKLTIPKNFSGKLYLSGLNIGSLSNKHVSAKFYYGRERNSFTVNGTIARAPGITPTTDIEVLVLNMDTKPFEDLRLTYDLYDYNEYDFDELDGGNIPSEFSGEAYSDSPVVSNLDDGLYCRGLNLNDDPTFTPSVSQMNCTEAGAKCLYSYAKVEDSGLINTENGEILFPTQPQIDLDGVGYFSDLSTTLTSRCLSDNVRFDDSGTVDLSGAYALISDTVFFDSLGGIGTIGENDFQFNGSYHSTNKPLWQIGPDASIGQYGLFLDTLHDEDPGNPFSKEDLGNVSLMFPRYIQRELSGGVEHLSSIRPNGYKSILPFPANGLTQWMDGCNERVATTNAEEEHIGSCNVSAIIEIIAKDPITQEEVIVAGYGDGGVEVKLQLVKASALNSVGEDVLFTNFRSCENSSACGADECCYNNKCWSKDIVSTCFEDTNGNGNEPVGSMCQSDFECSSLCCNMSTGKCSVHDSTQDPPVLCSKPSGQQCIAKEWCAQESIEECKIVKTELNEDGSQNCALRCYHRLTYGDCTNGICLPPATPTIPIFNPADPNRCDDAVDPPSE
jgi:hypothetical protein